MKHLKIFESIDNINLDEVIELMVDLEDSGLILTNVGDNHLRINDPNKNLSIIKVLDKLDDAMTQFDFEVQSITAFFSETAYRDWTKEQRFKFLNNYNYNTYEFLMKEYKYKAVAHIKDIRKNEIFSGKRYNEIFIVFTKSKEKKGIFKTIKSFFKSK